MLGRLLFFNRDKKKDIENTMQITTRLPIPNKIVSLAKLSPTIPEAKTEVRLDASRDSFEASPSSSVELSAEPAKRPSSPPPALPRPVIFLHGFNGKAEGWDNVIDWLASGDEPQNRSGGIVDAGQFDNLDSEANLFSLRLSRPYNSVERNKEELKATVEAVLEATGADEVDLVVHSLGGLNARHYLQDDNEKVNKLVMIGTPNHGSALANAERVFRENFDFPIFPPTSDPEADRILQQLSVDTLKSDGTPNNPWLRELNNDWTEQREQADILLIAGAGIPTLTEGPGITTFGDGVVTRRSATLEGIERKTSWFNGHIGMYNRGKVMSTTADFLAGNALPEDENLFETPEDAIRAAELTSSSKASQSSKVEKSDSKAVEKALKLPLMDPAFQLGLALGVVSAMIGGNRAQLPLIEMQLQAESGQAPMEANYKIDLERENGQVQGSGFVDGQAFAEVADFQAGKMNWRSAIGLQSSGLTMQVGEDEKSIELKGDMGGVATDLSLKLLHDSDGGISGLETSGLFNGEEYKMQSKIDMGGLGLLGGKDGMMYVDGQVNGQAMEREYQIAMNSSASGLQFQASSQGSEEGESVGVDVQVINRH